MILVVGATGNLGGAVTRMLLAQGQPVRILTGPQSNYQPLAEAGGLPGRGSFLKLFGLSHHKREGAQESGS